MRKFSWVDVFRWGGRRGWRARACVETRANDAR